MALKKVVIDAGHGGGDSGATANGIIEKEYTLRISNYIHDRLNDLGIENKLTRDEDITLEPNDRVSKVLNLFGDNKDVIVLSNHINAGGGDGAEVIYALRNNDTLSKKISSEIESTGQNVRKYYQRRLPSDPSKDYYYMLRNTGSTEAIIVEYGFLDSDGDDVLQLKNNWKKYAEAVVKALANYIGVSYIPLSDGTIYTVAKGDSLWSIAKKFNTTVDKIKELNNLSNNMLSIGQKLIVSDSDINNNYYIVKKGDTLYGIAKNNNISVDELIKLNNLSSTNLSIGQKLILKQEEKNELNKYVVQKGDTLYGIAKKYNVTVDDLMKANNLSGNSLSIGQSLSIPSLSLIYTVLPGDSLYSISRKYNTTVDKLKDINNLNSDVLSIGQKLIIK